jgi:hypothetical protein
VRHVQRLPLSSRSRPTLAGAQQPGVQRLLLSSGLLAGCASDRGRGAEQELGVVGRLVRSRAMAGA